MMRFCLPIILTCALLLLAACEGFKPLYGSSEATESSETDVQTDKLLNRIKFESVKDRSGQVLYTALYERLKTRQNSPKPHYLLKVTGLDINRASIGIAADGTSRLDQLIITGDFALEKLADNSQISDFRLRLVSTYNVVGADAYSTEAAFQSTRDRMLHDMSEQVRLRLLSRLRASE